MKNRGDRRESLFVDDADRELFLQTLRETYRKIGWQVQVLCPMASLSIWYWRCRVGTS